MRFGERHKVLLLLVSFPALAHAEIVTNSRRFRESHFCRPYRAFKPRKQKTQGVALGYYLSGFQPCDSC